MTSKPNKFIRTIKNVAQRNSVLNYRRRQAIIKFTEKFNFVYFGHVDQKDDEHHVIRGLTASSAHQDEHYSVGSFEGYDVSLVDRYDTVVDAAEHDQKLHRWLIVEIDLHSGDDIPHIFLGSHSSHQDSPYSKLFIADPSLQPVPLGTFGAHSEEFTKRYSLFAAATQFIEVERLFTVEVTRMIAAHFWPLSVEVYQGAVYIYSDSHLISVGLLEAMLKNGLWLAEKLDEHSYPTDTEPAQENSDD